MRWILCGFLLTIAAPVAWAEDEIERRGQDGKSVRLRGVVSDESPKAVAIRTARGDVEVPINEIVSVKYDRQPAELITIRVLIEQDKLDDALSQLETVYDRVKETPQEYLKATLQFQVFRVQARMALLDATKADAALKTADAFLLKYARSRHFYPLQELVGEVALAKGDYDAAKKAFAALKDADWPGYREKAMVYEGLAALQKGDARDALFAFDEVIRSAKDVPEAQEQKRAAQVFKAEALIRGADPKRVAEAEKLLVATLKELPETAKLVKAMGYNALGDALRAQKKPPLEVILEGYMKVYTLYPNDPQQHARAIYGLMEMFAQRGERDRVERMAQELRSQYPQSSWAKKLPKAEGN